LADLRLHRFVRAEPAAYECLLGEFESSLDYWRTRPLALDVHPVFRGLTPKAGAE
jgi:hypothetical protein